MKKLRKISKNLNEITEKLKKNRDIESNGPTIGVKDQLKRKALVKSRCFLYCCECV
ncbi:hypothetical protein [Thomasclavelia sp.]